MEKRSGNKIIIIKLRLLSPSGKDSQQKLKLTVNSEVILYAASSAVTKYIKLNTLVFRQRIATQAQIDCEFRSNTPLFSFNCCIYVHQTYNAFVFRQRFTREVQNHCEF